MILTCSISEEVRLDRVGIGVKVGIMFCARLDREGMGIAICNVGGPVPVELRLYRWG